MPKKKASENRDAKSIAKTSVLEVSAAEIALDFESKIKTSHLTAAKKAKNDEFYTQWADIEREMNAYLEFNPEVFKGKTVLLPCDDPDWSNFTKFFALHFKDYGLKKLISTSYAPNSKLGGNEYKPSIFELNNPGYDQIKSLERGRLFILENIDKNNDGVINIDDLQWSYLQGDGDFRSDEVIALRNEADIVITNPPFSLFREFIGWLTEGQIKFSIIGTSNAAGNKDVFPLIKNNILWKGATANNTDMVFRVPKGADVKASDRKKAARLGYASDNTSDYTRMGNSCWFTNIEHGRRHEPLTLMTASENLKYSRHKEIRGRETYLTYVNFDAIDIPFCDAIPSDYRGVMGVPISFLDKYNPAQFEILGFSNSGQILKELGGKTLGSEFIKKYKDLGGTGHISPGMYSLGLLEPKPRIAFSRILIRHK